MENLVEENRLKSIFLTDGKNVYFIPRGWSIEWTDKSGGIHFVDENGISKPEIMCYCPITTRKNSDVETLFVRVCVLSKLREINETEAKAIHPKLFSLLDEINELHHNKK